MAGGDWSGLLLEMPMGQDKPSLVPDHGECPPVLGAGGGSRVRAKRLEEWAVSGTAAALGASFQHQAGHRTPPVPSERLP